MCWLTHAAHLRLLPHFLLYLLAIPGGVECFAGFRAWRFLLGLNGVFVGAVAGFMACLIVVPNPFLALAGGFFGAIAGGVLFANVQPVGTFLVGILLGFSSVSLAAIALETTVSGLLSALAIAAGFVVAGLLVVLDRPAILLFSSLAGAAQLSALLAACLYPLEIPLPPIPWLQGSVFLTLAAGGLTTQWLTNRPSRHAAADAN